MNDVTYLVQPGGALSGTVRVPGDKSISHRAFVILSAAKDLAPQHSGVHGARFFAALRMTSTLRSE